MSKSAQTPAPWPEHINAASFKAHSNARIGADKTSVFKTMLSIRTMIGVGMAASLLLPTKIVAVVAAMMTLPQLILTLARHYQLIEDRLKTAHPVLRGRYAAEIEGDFCVFHIGLTVNTKIPAKEIAQVGRSFQSMLSELEADPEKYGFYGAENFVAGNISAGGTLAVQFWRSQEHVNAYARDHMSKHFPAMLWSSKYVKVSPDVGFWHEGFTVRAGEYEGIYVNCPQMLLGKAGRVVRAIGRKRTALGRLGLSDGNDLQEVEME
jgi:Domain of unknown function (DUF4188)